jgi:hypothetical protein
LQNPEILENLSIFEKKNENPRFSINFPTFFLGVSQNRPIFTENSPHIAHFCKTFHESPQIFNKKEKFSIFPSNLQFLSQYFAKISHLTRNFPQVRALLQNTGRKIGNFERKVDFLPLFHGKFCKSVLSSWKFLIR